jgi:hypothetical protein
MTIDVYSDLMRLLGPLQIYVISCLLYTITPSAVYIAKPCKFIAPISYGQSTLKGTRPVFTCDLYRFVVDLVYIEP